MKKLTSLLFVTLMVFLISTQVNASVIDYVSSIYRLIGFTPEQTNALTYESFDATTFPPTGWTIKNRLFSVPWGRATSSTNPYCLPHSGAGMIRQPGNISYPTGDISWLITPSFSLTSGQGIVSFWIYRSLDNPGSPDSVGVWINTIADTTGANFQPLGNVSRFAPVNGWYKYTFLIPSSYNTATNYLLFGGNTFGGALTNVDDISYGVPTNMSFVSSVVTANTNPVSPNSTENQIISIPLTVAGTSSPFTVTKLKLQTTGTTNPANDIRNAKIYYTGNYSTFTTASQYATLFGNIVTNPNGSFEITGTQALLEGTNYFWLTYDVTSGAAQGNTISAVCDSVIGTGLGAIAPTPAAPGGRTIYTQIPGGTYVIGPGQTSPNYATFTAAFNDLSTRGISGPVLFNVKPAVYGTDAGVEVDSTITLSQISGVSNVNTVTFKKKSDEPGEVWLERRGINTSAVDNIITLNGVSFVTFDSINVRQKDTSSYNHVETGYMLKNSTKDNGSQYNTIRNSKIFLKASNVNSIGIKDSVAVPIISYSGANSYNKYQYNTILNCYSGIKSYGFSGSANPQYTNGQFNEIIGNTITGFGGTSTATYGIYTNLQMFIKIAGNILISGSTSTNAVYGIFMQGNNYGNLDVYSNTVTLASGTTSQIIGGIYIQAVPGNSGSIRTHCNIQNNTLKDFNLAETNSGQFYGIYAAGGTNATDTMNVTGNVVKNCTIGGTGANICAMFYIQGSSVNLNISNDSIYNITKIGTGTGVFYNIYQNNLGSKGVSKIFNNYVSNDSIKASSNVYGIYDNGSANADSCLIYGNTINGIRTSSTAVAYGIYTNNGINRFIYNNKVNNIKNWASGGSTHGLWINSGHNVFAYNNSLSNLRTPSATGSNAVTGIYLFGPAGPSKVYLNYNSIYLADTSSSVTYGNSGIYVADTNIVEISNNNVVNISKSGGTGVNSAVVLRLSAAATLRNAVVTSGNNNWFTGSSSLLYYDVTNSFNETQWQQFRAYMNPREQGSVNINPAFVDAYGGDLHINTATPTLLFRGALPVTSPIAINKDFDGNTRNTTYPCIGFSEFNGTYATDVANPVIRYERFGNGSSVNKTITGIAITDYSKIDTSVNRPRVYYKKTTNANTINDNTSTTDGWKYTSADGTGGTPFSFTINYSLLFGGGVSQGDTIQYFIVAQDLASTPNVGINSGSFAVLPASVNLGAVNLPLSGIINRYTITSAISNSINVGSAETVKSLTGTGGLFDLINKGVVTGNITAVITSDLSESGQHSIKGWSELTSAPLNYKLKIIPDGTTERVISGWKSYTNNTAYPDSMGLIRFFGASNVTIDGGAGKYLTIRNKAQGSAINFLMGSTFDTVKNCKIESYGNTSYLQYSPVIFTKGSLTQGNSYNVIANNVIRQRSDTTSNTLYQAMWSEGLGIYSQNAYNLIYGNEIANFTNGGIFLSSSNTGNGNGWTIRKNSFYFNLPLVFTGQWMPISASLGIYGGLTVDSNYIGGTAANCGGTYFYSQNSSNIYAMSVSAGLDTINTIRANVIQNIRSYPGLDGSTMRFNGIQTSSGWIDIKDNIFGSTDTSKTIWYNGNLRMVEVSNSILGIVRPVTISNNTFTNIYTRKDSLIKVLGGTLQRYMINIASATVPLEISDNTFSNIYSWQTPDVSTNGTYFTKLSGILLSSSQKLVIKNNTFTNIGNMSTIPYMSQSRNFIYAIDNVGGMGDSSMITMNRINNVFSKNPSGANDLVAGIFNNGPASIGQSIYITNNQITMTDNSSNLGEVFGIYEPTYATFYNSFSHYYNNTVLLGGTSNSNVPSYCYYKNPATTITTVLKNNIFYNGRTSPNASNYALGVAFYGLDKKNKSEGGSPVMGGSPTFSSNYNFYVSTSASAVCDWYGSSKSFADWKTYTGYDLNSLSDTSANIPYTTLFRLPSSGNLNIDTTQYGASFVYRRGIGNPIVPTDFNGYPRSTSGPINIGSHEFALSKPVAVNLVSPANNSTGVQIPATLVWTRGLYASGYRLQISLDSTFTTYVVNTYVTDSTYSLANPQALTKYYWRVNPVYTPGINGDYTSVYNFKIIGGATRVVLSSPANNVIEQPLNITFKWFKAIDQTVFKNSDKNINNIESPLSISNYWFELATDSGFVNIVSRDSTLTDSTKSITGLEYNTKYFWKVKSKNQFGWAEFSLVWNFKTSPLIYPPNDTTGIFPTLTINWPDVPGALTYGVQLSTDSLFGSTILNVSGLPVSQVLVPDGYLMPMSKYYWHVNSTNADSTTGWTPTYRFSTLGQPKSVILATPANLDSNVAAINTVFKWFKAAEFTDQITNERSGKKTGIETDEPEAISKYWFELVTDTTTMANLLQDTTVTDTVKTVASLNNLTNYFFRVRALNEIGWGTFSGWNKFKTTLALPTLLTPANNATELALTQTFDWTDAPTATSYDFQLATDAAFTSLVYNITGQPLSTFTTPVPLTQFTQYYWRVRSTGPIGTTPYYTQPFTFKTRPDAPVAPALISPANNSTGLTLPVTVAWSKISNAYTYRLQVSTNSGFTSFVYDDSTLTDTAKTLDGLQTVTTYYWRVNVTNSSGTSPYAGPWNFRAIGIPNSVTLVTPANGAIDQPVDINFVWRKAVEPLLMTGSKSIGSKLETDDQEAISKYFFELTQDTVNFTGIYRDSTTTDTTLYVDSLQNNRTYFWRVKARNDNGTGNFSAWSRFKTIVTNPVFPVLVTPANNAINQRIDTIVFHWRKVNDNVLNSLLSGKERNEETDGNMLRGKDNNTNDNITAKDKNGMQTDELTAISMYIFQMALSGTDTSTIIVQDTNLAGPSDTTLTLTGFANSTNYYWRVKAKNQAGEGPFSPWFKFTTIIATPIAPVLTAPVNGATNVSLTPTFSWGAVTGASTYRLQVSTSNTFSGTVYDTVGLASNSITIPAGKLSGAVTYYWRVNATNVGGTSPYSTVWNFSTAQSMTLNLKVYLEGSYTGLQEPDTINVYLANSTAPFAFVDTAKVILSSTGTAVAVFSKATDGNYYIVVNHRNHLETWSKLPKAFVTNGTVTYDFTTAATQAYGDNMKQVGSVWVLYGGDANRDGSIDAMDVPIIISQFGLQGYLAADFDGNGDVNALDVAIFVPNFGLTKAMPVGTVNAVIKTKEHDLTRILDSNRKSKDKVNTQDKNVKKNEVKKNNN